MGFLGLKKKETQSNGLMNQCLSLLTTQRNRCLLGVEACASLGEDRGAEEEESKKGRHARNVISTPGPKPFES